MYNRIDIEKYDDLFLTFSHRKAEKGVYFVRISLVNQEIKTVLWKYHEASRNKGIIIEGQISNPDERQLAFFTEMMGNTFQPDSYFIEKSLQKWMPRMKPEACSDFAGELSRQLYELKKSGKTDSALKNLYVKVMCWLYYRFERLIPFVGQDDPPRILYEANSITNHELIFLRILSSLGVDILLLEPSGDQAYLKHDPQSIWSQIVKVDGSPFPGNFSLKQFRKEMTAVKASGLGSIAPVFNGRLNAVAPKAGSPAASFCKRDPESYFPKPEISACTNVWMKSASYTEVLTPQINRGNDFRFFYNSYIRVRGVSDKSTYLNELYQFYQQLKNTNRNIVIVDNELGLPGAEEIQKIRRHPYRNSDELIVDIAGNLPSCANANLQKLIRQSFVRTMKYAAEQEQNLNRLVVSAVYLLCWIHNYHSELYQGYKGKEIPCFILMGGCNNQYDALFIRYLSQLPVDVLIFSCDLSRKCYAGGENILELSNEESLPVPKFPRDAGTLQMRTLASSAEQDLSSVLYTDSGIYRNFQFSQADAITLQTTYDEIFILWNQELKYRPNFGTVNQVVNMPVIYATVAGLEDSQAVSYWQKIKLLLGDTTYLIKTFPFSTQKTGNPFYSLAVKAFNNGKLKRKVIKSHRLYPFGLLREDLQEYIFDKLQMMLDKKLIKGTFVNGTEYTVISTVLNLKKELVHMLQSFDFTKKNPKIVGICVNEQVCSLEDAILFTFLNLVGFDIVLFVPTGYQTIERYLNDNFPAEHQIGEYAYDLQVPDFDSLPPVKKRSWIDHFLKRGFQHGNQF